MKKVLFAIIALMSFSAASATTVSIPTDSKAIYTIIDKDMNGSMSTITTMREGPSGTSYSKRLYDCTAWTVKYLGDGDTLEQMKASRADESMSPIVDNSIAYYIGQRACK
ncbi:hypothetical protein ACU4M6_004257 [Raoultella ornithinolytica]|uniref:hypothetical protein n=1 Tax=Raoultella TaxID=160674 RepID=UPI001CC8F2BF|nr:hypothetical protein [Raoultella planticola]ELK6036047.1 hypothetical protein [Raoultella ornithinolytica]ELM7287965.1 hypothetical protein [Raoultella ornithinolytica]ELO0974496.1 hypothetical protein [Raoultella ornithinolytica]MBZ7829888.1 hypothetical protein [Raoultella planticola]HAV2260072.1 hypothetical protein [Raoultella ornithinolytica]